MRELQVYNGAVPQVAQQKFVQVQAAPKVEGHGEAVDRALGQAVDAANKVIDLHDFSEGQKTELGRRQIANEASDALQAKLALPYDDEESLYLPDGRLDENKLNAFVNEWQQKYIGVKADFWRSENAMKDAYRQQDDAARLDRSIRTAVVGRELHNRKQYFQDNVELAMLKGDYPGAQRAYDDALAGGMMTKTEHRIALMKLKQREEKERLAEMRQAERNNKLAAGDVTFELLDGMKSGAPAEVSAAGDVKLARAAVDPLVNAKVEVLEAGLDVERSASITLGDGGFLSVELSESPSDVSVWQAARASQGGYTLGEHRLDVAQVAAAVLSDENYAGLTDEQRRKMIAQRVHLVGGAQLFFDGDEAAYEGWIMNQAAQLAGLKGVVDKTDRMLAGYAGGKGIEALLDAEVTEQEARDVWEGDRLLADESVEGIKAREALYLKYRDEWAAETGEEPRKDIIAAGDLSDFMEWYQQKGGKHDQLRASFVKGVRDVYRQKAIDAVLGLRAERVAKLSDGTVVELDGKSDWAVEQRVIRDALGRPLTRADYGTLEALARQEAVLADGRRQRAKLYAAKGRESQAKVSGFNEAEKKAAAFAAGPAIPALDAAIAEDAAVRAKDAKKKETAAKALNKQLGQGVPVRARWDGKKGAEAPKVVMPASAYAAIAENLGAKDGFFVVLPGSSEPVPVEPDDKAGGVVFNKACISMLKKGKFSKAELDKVVNGAAVKMKFTKDSVRYDF